VETVHGGCEVKTHFGAQDDMTEKVRHYHSSQHMDDRTFPSGNSECLGREHESEVDRNVENEVKDYDPCAHDQVE
jgi:hypothetical protein